ncbi:MAG: DUF4249 domain-containing protein [Bacteroidota bacterium]
MKFSHIIPLLLIATSLVSCTEVIDIDLNESEQTIVIEGILRDRPDGNQVQITKTGSYFSPGEYPTVSDAMVSITDSDGNQTTLSETEDGIYSIPFAGESGETYTLTVEAEGESYEAVAKMQEPISIDSISFFERGSNPLFGGDGGFAVVANLLDPEGTTDYLLFELEVNGELQSSLTLYEGSQTDGISVQVPFIPLLLQEGDEVIVNTYAIEREAYEYYNTLAEIAGTGFATTSATPANPISNWSNDALGYFGVLAQTRFEAVVQ